MDEGKQLSCVWTGGAIKSGRQLEVDHILPFSVWRNNDLWNLMPSSVAANRDKRDLVPSVELLDARKKAILVYWEVMKTAYPVRFEKEMKIALLGEGQVHLDVAFERLQEKCRYMSIS